MSQVDSVKVVAVLERVDRKLFVLESLSREVPVEPLRSELRGAVVELRAYVEGIREQASKIDDSERTVMRGEWRSHGKAR